MKIAILADLHIGVKNASDIMIEHQKKFFNFFFDYLEQNQIDTVVQLGDLFDSRKNANFKVLNFAYEQFFDKIEQHKLNFHTLIGNHDVFYKETLSITSSDLVLRNYQHVHVHDTPTTLCFDGVTFDLIPWICNENQDQCFKYIGESTSDYCCGHFAINEFPVMGNMLYEGGVDKNIFSHYKHVFSGHFHSRSHKQNITYVGIPYQLTWSDALTKNGFIVFDTQTHSWEYVENDDRYYFYMTYDDSRPGASTNPQSINIENSFIKVIVAAKNKPALFANYINTIIKNHPADLKIIDQQLIDIQNANIITPQGIIKGTLQLIDKYIDQLEYDNKSALRATMTSLYNEAIAIQDDLNADN